MRCQMECVGAGCEMIGGLFPLGKPSSGFGLSGIPSG